MARANTITLPEDYDPRDISGLLELLPTDGVDVWPESKSAPVVIGPTLKLERYEVAAGVFIVSSEVPYALVLPTESFELFTGGFTDQPRIIPLREIVYSQSSLYFANTPATVETMIDGSTVGSATGNNFDQLAWVKMDLGDEYTVDRVFIGTATTTMPGGWDKFYTENANLQYSLDDQNWTTFANTGEFESEGIYQFDVFISARYIRIARTNYVALTEFYALVSGQTGVLPEDIFIFSGPFIDALQDDPDLSEYIAAGPFAFTFQDVTETADLVSGAHIFNLPILGEQYQGGFYAGSISHSADSVPTHLLIVAPKNVGESGITLWRTFEETVPAIANSFDGAANLDAMVNAGIDTFPAASFCYNLNINGYSDWYLPSEHELGIAYINLKPTSQLNISSRGANPFSVPRRFNNYSEVSPGITTVSAFNAVLNGAQAFNTSGYWVSNSMPGGTGALTFNNGAISLGSPSANFHRARAFRKFNIADPQPSPFVIVNAPNAKITLTAHVPTVSPPVPAGVTIDIPPAVITFRSRAIEFTPGIAAGTVVYIPVSDIQISTFVPARIGAPIPWTPAQITTVLWLDASDPNTITASGGLVSQWSDKSGAGRHAIQDDVARRPALTTAGLSGLDVITFDGMNDSMRYPTIVLNDNNSFVFSVYERPASGVNSIDVGAGESNLELNSYRTGYGNLWNPFNELRSLLRRITGSFDNARHGSASSSTGNFINSLVRSNAGTQAWRNGNALGDPDLAFASGTANLANVGSSASREYIVGGYHTGNIAEVIVGRTSITTEDRHRIEGYLAHKWGLTAGLPSGHPFKTDPPVVLP
jgi:hypothetical protein